MRPPRTDPMRSIFDPDAPRLLGDRLRSISPSTPALWGRMTAHQMVCHTGDQIRCSIGEIPVRPKKTVLWNSALRYLVVHLLPWPKGRVPTAREMQSTQPGKWNADVATTAELLLRAASRGPDAEWAVHPAFGPLSGREWGQLIFKHTDYHLRQFGA